ncbi:hypothetical protein CCM_03406 [Cordyceps militaris CM01]|uniref:Uncharacterized protein n=1 Tax=Cordyceps militaris (strain CM01) TaxID=983644 RepID=G3JAL9_CORMM|nr:uncharacterized protein CCM_03406 [Cordyceps militaris CM01]EGX95134.1 hypothetical protein CCM_03406 [Cordyceps militaris CM01]
MRRVQHGVTSSEASEPKTLLPPSLPARLEHVLELIQAHFPIHCVAFEWPLPLEVPIFLDKLPQIRNGHYKASTRAKTEYINTILEASVETAVPEASVKIIETVSEASVEIVETVSEASIKIVEAVSEASIEIVETVSEASVEIIETVSASVEIVETVSASVEIVETVLESSVKLRITDYQRTSRNQSSKRSGEGN